MSNMNIGTPKIYPDLCNYRMSTGTAQNLNFDVISGSDLISTFTQGSESELFDLKPMNQCSWDTSSTSAKRADHVLVNMDTGGSFNVDYIAILNHNFNSSEAKIRIGHSATESNVNNVDLTGSTAPSNMTEVVNGDTINTDVVIPGTDGSTIVSFDQTSNRYWGIQIEGATGASTLATTGTFSTSNDVQFSIAMFGEAYSLPHSPNMGVIRTITYDGVNVQESIGGQKYSNSSHLGRNFISSMNQSPFSKASTSYYQYSGRMKYDMKFSYVSSSDIMPDQYHSELSTADTVVSDVWNRTKGQMFPFIFTQDGTSTDESDYLFARFDSELNMTQVAHQYWDVGVSIIEEF